MYKVLLLGESGVGKTKLIERYVSHTFTPNSSATIAFDMVNILVPLNSEGEPCSSPVSAEATLATAAGHSHSAPTFVSPLESATFEDQHHQTVGKSRSGGDIGAVASFGLTSNISENDHAKVQLWDTAGQERYNAFTNVVYRGAHGAIIVYDVTSRAGFEHAEQWVNRVRQLSQLPDGSEPSILLVGNKTDLVHIRTVSQEEAVAKAQHLRVPYIETSALLNDNVEKCFRLLIGDVHRRMYTFERDAPLGSGVSPYATNLSPAVSPTPQGVVGYSSSCHNRTSSFPLGSPSGEATGESPQVGNGNGKHRRRWKCCSHQ